MANITLLDLPFDILSNIFKSLTLTDLNHVMLTCKTLRNLITEDNRIWRSFFFVCNSLENNQPELSPYMLCRISRNWCNGIYRPKFVNFPIKYMPWLKLYNTEAVFVSLGSKLISYQLHQHGFKDGAYNWCIEVPKVDRHDIRTNDISRFVMKNNLIVCGNRDGCAIVYEFRGTKRKPELLHHILDCHDNGLSEVSAVELINGEGVSVAITGSSTSNTIRFWYITGDETSDIISVPNIVGTRCLALNKSQTKLVIGPNGNSKPLLLDVGTSKLLSCKDVTTNARQAVRDVQWHDENTVAYVTHSGKLELIDTRTCELVYESNDPFMVTLYCVRTDGERALVAGSAAHARCVIYDRRRARRHVQMYFTTKRSSPIYSLDFDSTRLFAAADVSLVSLNFDVTPDKSRQRDYSSFDFNIVV